MRARQTLTVHPPHMCPSMGYPLDMRGSTCAAQFCRSYASMPGAPHPYHRPGTGRMFRGHSWSAMKFVCKRTENVVLLAQTLPPVRLVPGPRSQSSAHSPGVQEQIVNILRAKSLDQRSYTPRKIPARVNGPDAIPYHTPNRRYGAVHP